jgi:hypothetical protein
MIRLWVFFLLALLTVIAACNPFAPAVSESASTVQFGDPHTVDGYFQAFQYAYEFKDTSVYGSLLAPSFIFSFHDYNQGVDIQWGRDDEMQTTATLFQNVQTISLLWGDVLDAEGTATGTDSTVTRAFSLDITFNEEDIEHADGSAVFHLQRASPTAVWQAVSWQDESTF